jgi:[methyl-Co(III) methanol-specific corrinoid protein]:coenzyme M methyltransferase
MGDVFSPKERLLRVARGQGVDRPPVICPGGMMNAAIVDVMQKTGHVLPAAHHDGLLMGELACDVQHNTGFENFGLPFCMTVEPEALGSAVEYGSLKCEPKVQKEAFSSVKEAAAAPAGGIEQGKRAGAVLQALDRLAKTQPDIPAIGSLSGPVSTAASLVDPMTFFRELHREKEAAHRFMAKVTAALIQWARLMVDNGAALICIADPTATGEILGPKLFEQYALPYINQIAESVAALGTPVIVHICGDVRPIKRQLFNLRGDVLSVDAMVNLAELKAENRNLVTMGNLSTYLLEQGTEKSVSAAAAVLLKKEIHILAPACGLSTTTPLENIRAFTGTVHAAAAQTHGTGGW